ncbi:MAG: type II toxin-antitoxin system Phd/YefM family antitoxin [Betaproteobacteria bacterium]|nr:type II toxin-antitoxin system Phd/YefM family antitoxin [Betaproteobacteria bacterium]
MTPLYAATSTSISELKKRPSEIIESADGAPVAILNHNRPTAYLVPASTFEALMERIEDLELAALVHARADEPSVKVKLNDL